MTSLQEQKTISRGSILMSRSENLQGFYSKWPRLEMGVQFSQLSLLPFYFIASFCSLLDIYDNVHLKVLGYLFLVSLSCHTRHVAHDNFEDEIFWCFYG